jgi:hypothetical protein
MARRGRHKNHGQPNNSDLRLKHGGEEDGERKRDLKGHLMQFWPEDLRIREFPLNARRSVGV